MKLIKNYASLVRFSHTIFAMPFAMIGFFYALEYGGVEFEYLLIIKVLLAMVFARNAAMGFNRYADREIDAQNLRTASREIPSGVVPAKNALWFVLVNCLLFILCALWINRLSFYLAPIALLVVLGYSVTKRFTAWCHIILGVGLGIAPVGAYIAVTGSFAIFPILISGLVITWTAGFDIIYSLQDEEFDRTHNLHSVPARFGAKKALIISALLHLITIYAIIVAGVYINGGVFYWIGAAIFCGLLVFQHLIVSPSNISRVGLAFGTTNGIASVVYALAVISDMYI